MQPRDVMFSKHPRPVVLCECNGSGSCMMCGGTGDELYISADGDEQADPCCECHGTGYCAKCNPGKTNAAKKRGFALVRELNQGGG